MPRVLPVPCILLVALGAVPPAGAAPSAEEIAAAARRLGDASYSAREEASAFLWRAGEAALPALRAAAETDDAEVAARARDVLGKLALGLRPETPPEVAALAAHYRDADPGARLPIVGALLDAGKPALPVVAGLYRAETEPAARAAFHEQLTRRPDLIPALLAAGEGAAARDLLAIGAEADYNLHIRNYAAYHLLSDSLDAEISRWAPRLEGADAPRAARVLAHLHRAKGDLAAAREFAAKSGQPGVQEALAYESGDWAFLARSFAGRNPRPEGIEDAGFLAACHRLAGDAGAFATALAAVQSMAGGTEPDAWFVAEALLLNDRPAAALEILRTHRKREPRFELLCAQDRFDEAFAVLEPAGDDAAENDRLELLRCRTLYRLGRREEAAAGFEALATRAAAEARGGGGGRAAALLGTLVELGADDLVESIGARLSEVPGGPATGVLGSLVPGRGDVATVWYLYLSERQPEAAARSLFPRVRRLASAPPAEEGWVDRVREAQAWAEKERAAPSPGLLLDALAETCRAGGRDDLACALLEKAAARDPTAARLVKAGDALARAGRWTDAADRYGRAWELERRASALYLQGDAMARSGRETEGRSRMALARLLPLAQDAARHDLAEALEARGLAKESEAERELLFRVGTARTWHSDQALKRRAREAAERGDLAEAARLWERFLVNGHRKNIAFVHPGAYLSVPASVHLLRARAHLTAGRPDEALVSARAALAAVPAEVDVPIELVPELERRDRKTEADALYQEVFGRLETVLRQYPESAAHLNRIAWLAAKCRRGLDRASADAEKAVALAPRTAAYLDTLAEVHFQRGDAAKALELARRCVDLDPQEPHYRRQRDRFASGKPRAGTGD